MCAAVLEEPRVIHALPGRIRVHLAEWDGGGEGWVERQVRQFPGVRNVQASRLTGNVLIQFDPSVTNVEALLTKLRHLGTPPSEESRDVEDAPHVHQERRGSLQRARISVRGLDRDPELARVIEARLERLPGVRARASTLTGRVVVEWSSPSISIEDLVAEVAQLELPSLPLEGRPAHPLDTEPLAQSLATLLGSTLGLGFLALRRMLGQTGPPVASAVPLVIADVITILRSFPLTRNGLRRLMGRQAADTLFSTASNATLAIGGLPLGLALNQAEGLRQFTEVSGRRSAWRRYEGSVGLGPAPRSGSVVHAEAGEHFPFAAQVREGTGTTVSSDGMPALLVPGSIVPPGAPVYGGPFVLELKSPEAFTPEPRPLPNSDSLLTRYLRVSGIASIGYAVVRGLLTRSPAQAYNSLLLLNPRVALVGGEAADIGAAARVTRAGGIVVGTRPERTVRLPQVIILDQPRLLIRGFEVAGVLPLSERATTAHILALARGLSAAAHHPWGNVFPVTHPTEFTEGQFEGSVATAYFNGTQYSLSPPGQEISPAVIDQFRSRGEYLLVLQSELEQQPLGLISLRPRIADGVSEMVQLCQRHRVEVILLSAGDRAAAEALAHRAGISLLHGEDAIALIRTRQRRKEMVAFVSDHAHTAAAFSACDLAIGINNSGNEFPARADILIPDLSGVAAIVEAGAKHTRAVRDSTLLSVLANILGVMGGFFQQSFVRMAVNITSIGALVAMAIAWWRLRGGQRPRSSITRIADPRPEQWGRRSVEDVLHTLDTGAEGLTSAEAAERYRQAPTPVRRHRLVDAVLEQVRSPIVGIMAAGGLFSLLVGNIIDVLLIGATICFNVAVGVWQERQADQTVETLERMGTPTARVLRENQMVILPADTVVPGDVLVLAPGDRVAADARLLSAEGLEVDEAMLTGESLPVVKHPTSGNIHDRIVLAGSDVTSGTGLAVVFAVGPQTRLGATAAALAIDGDRQNPLAIRLSRMLRLALPISMAAGVLVLAGGLLRGQPLWAQLAIGTSVAIAAIPEGLPLLSKISEAAVARRLAGRKTLVRRLSAVEALGRVDVACADKTGTLTEGRLALSTVCTLDEEATLSGELSAELRHVLLTAALASPHPDGPGAITHPTDQAIISGAQGAGLGQDIQVERIIEVPFDPVRGFHATVAVGRLCIKGAPEVLLPYCERVRRNGEEQTLDEDVRHKLLDSASDLAVRGLRVLMVAEGGGDISAQDPHGLVALGLLGIRDSLRPTVPAAVRRCWDAGIHLVMITGDHPETARTIAREAGILNGYDGIITGQEIMELSDQELGHRLEATTVIARATPLDKVRIVESLQQLGHTVAMTGDGVNDAPALRLADVGVAMGYGTEVAKQAADVVLVDNDFSNLVEILVEGRSFWQRIRRAVGLLVGGNLGELGLITGLVLLGQSAPLTTRQILGVNMISDVLPALAIGLQRPEQRNLASLAREGVGSLEEPLHRDILRRGFCTAAPAIVAYLAMRGAGVPVARTVGFASIVATQLAQTLDMGIPNRSTVGALLASAGLLVVALTFAPLRDLLTLAPLPPLGWALVTGASLAAVLLSRMLSSQPNGKTRLLFSRPALS